MTGPRGGSGRSLISRFDPYILTPILLGLLLFQPLLARGLPQAPDALIHFYRGALWRWAWDGGALWPRWQTLAFQGYGYPVLSFQAPLLYFLTAALSYVTPGLLVAFKGVVLAACLLYGIGMYLWARDVLGRRGAVLASAAYVFAAFRFRELYFVGGYSQFLAFGLYPLVLYFYHWLAMRPSRGCLVGAVLGLAALVMTHNISALLFAPVFGVYLLGVAIAYRRTGAWRRLAVAAVLALAVSAIFWLPAVGEMASTQTQVLTQGHWDVRVHFLRAGDFVARSSLLDDRAANPPLPFNFGWLHLALAGLGALTLLRPPSRPLYRFHIAFALAVAGISAWMMLPASYPLWRVAPLIRYAEYPWRLFGIAFLGSSLLAGGSLAWLERMPRLQLAAGTAAMVGLIVATAGYQFPRPFLQAGATPRDYLAYETAFRAVGTTAGNEFLPPAVQELPSAPAVGPDLVRTALIAPASGVQAVVTGETASSLRLRVSMPQASEVTVSQFDFPGWRAWVDGRPVSIRAAPGTGLIAVAVPAGEHELLLRFGDTPPRRAGAILSLLGLVGTAFVAWRIVPGGRAPGAAAEAQADGGAEARGRAGVAPWAGGGVMAGAVLILLVLKAAWVGPHTQWFRLSSPPGEAVPAQHAVHGDLSGAVALLGYDLDATSVTQGGELPLRLYWQALKPLGADYASFVELVAGPEEQSFARSDNDIPGYIPSATWDTGRYVVDSHRISAPGDAPAVSYVVRAGLYDPKTLDRLGTIDLPDRVHILPARPLREADVRSAPTAQFGGKIRLLGHRVEERDGALDLTLYWQAGETPDGDYQVFVHLLDGSGRMVGQSDGPPVGGYYPASTWLPGQIIADLHSVPLSGEGRPATVAVGLYDLASGERLPAAAAGGARLKDDALVIPIGGSAAP
jgi:hypothetical protein